MCQACHGDTHAICSSCEHLDKASSLSGCRVTPEELINVPFAIRTLQIEVRDLIATMVIDNNRLLVYYSCIGSFC